MTNSAFFFNSREHSRRRFASANALDCAGLLSLLLPQCFHGWRKRKRRPEVGVQAFDNATFFGCGGTQPPIPTFAATHYIKST